MEDKIKELLRFLQEADEKATATRKEYSQGGVFGPRYHDEECMKEHNHHFGEMQRIKKEILALDPSLANRVKIYIG